MDTRLWITADSCSTHCSTSADTFLQFSLYVPPPAFASCLAYLQKLKY